MRTFLFFLILLSLSFQLKAQEQQVVVPYTLADRDRAIRTEARMEAFDAKMDAFDAKMGALETKMDVKFESQQKQLDQLTNMLFWGFGVITSLILFILGYTIWDRRTALQPALDKSKVAEENSRKLTNALREYSKKHPDLAELLRTYGLL